MDMLALVPLGELWLTLKFFCTSHAAHMDSKWFQAYVLGILHYWGFPLPESLGPFSDGGFFVGLLSLVSVFIVLELILRLDVAHRREFFLVLVMIQIQAAILTLRLVDQALRWLDGPGGAPRTKQYDFRDLFE